MSTFFDPTPQERAALEALAAEIAGIQLVRRHNENRSAGHWVPSVGPIATHEG